MLSMRREILKKYLIIVDTKSNCEHYLWLRGARTMIFTYKGSLTLLCRFHSNWYPASRVFEHKRNFLLPEPVQDGLFEGNICLFTGSGSSLSVRFRVLRMDGPKHSTVLSSKIAVVFWNSSQGIDILRVQDSPPYQSMDSG